MLYTFEGSLVKGTPIDYVDPMGQTHQCVKIHDGIGEIVVDARSIYLTKVHDPIMPVQFNTTIRMDARVPNYGQTLDLYIEQAIRITRSGCVPIQKLKSADSAEPEFIDPELTLDDAFGFWHTVTYQVDTDDTNVLLTLAYNGYLFLNEFNCEFNPDICDFDKYAKFKYLYVREEDMEALKSITANTHSFGLHFDADGYNKAVEEALERDEITIEDDLSAGEVTYSE